MCKNRCQGLPVMERCNSPRRDRQERMIVCTTWFILRWIQKGGSPLIRDRESECWFICVLVHPVVLLLYLV